MMMPGRKYSATSSYRYGVQGQESDNEVKGEGNSISFDFRVHDPRIGRFLSVDPLSGQYPHNSPYAFAENKVLQFVELEGGEITLPRYGPIIPEPIIQLPKVPTMPLPPTPPPIIPHAPNIPHTPPMPLAPNIPVFPINPGITRSVPIDESTIDPNDATTYPTPPFEGTWKVEPVKPGTKGYEKLKEKGATRLENEKGDVLRWHSRDKYHPKGHWDLKRGGSPNNPWENYTPDGTKIPDGQIYGKDFNPLLIPTKPHPLDTKEVTKRLLELGAKIKYQQQLNQYKKDLKKYEEQKKDYDKKMKEYIDKGGVIL
jgi:RHS repeat-associated protein